MRLSKLLLTVLSIGFTCWAIADWGIKPASRDLCLRYSTPLENCTAYQNGFVISSISGYTAITSAGIWFAFQLFSFDPVLFSKQQNRDEEDEE
jgi:hypothetical protein